MLLTGIFLGSNPCGFAEDGFYVELFGLFLLFPVPPGAQVLGSVGAPPQFHGEAVFGRNVEQPQSKGGLGNGDSTIPAEANGSRDVSLLEPSIWRHPRVCSSIGVELCCGFAVQDLALNSWTVGIGSLSPLFLLVSKEKFPLKGSLKREVSNVGISCWRSDPERWRTRGISHFLIQGIAHPKF